MTFDRDVCHGGSSSPNPGQVRCSRPQEKNVPFSAVSKKVKLREPDRAKKGKANRNWKMQISNTSHRVVGVTSSGGFSSYGHPI